MTKLCCTCGEYLPATKEFFHVRKSSSDGLRCDCKKCRKEKIPKRDRKTKRCSYCGEMKPNTTEFYLTESSGGLRARCKTCYANYQKEYKLIKKYNLSLDNYNKKCAEQDRKCQICEREIKLYVDHDHTSGNVRGLLCDLCNRGLGLFKENIQSLSNAILYLKKYE